MQRIQNIKQGYGDNCSSIEYIGTQISEVEQKISKWNHNIRTINLWERK